MYKLLGVDAVFLLNSTTVESLVADRFLDTRQDVDASHERSVFSGLASQGPASRGCGYFL